MCIRDSYLTVPAEGELGNQILNHIAQLSKDLATYIHVDKDNNKAHVIMDTSSMMVEIIQHSVRTCNSLPILLNVQYYFESEPI